MSARLLPPRPPASSGTASGLSLLVLAACGVVTACSDGTPTTAPGPEALFSCLVGDALRLSPGEAFQSAGPGEARLCLSAEGGAEYLYVPFYASPTGDAQVQVEVAGGGSRPPADPLPAGAAGGAGAAGAALAPAAGAPRLNDGFHRELRERERRGRTPLLPDARAALGPRAAPASVRRRAADVPSVGSLLTLNTVPSCERQRLRTGRVEAVGQHAIIVADTANPAGGFAQADWEFFAAAMDTLVWPVEVGAFGEPTDIDGNGRVVVFFTRAVNELTPPGSTSFVAGFFWSGDLFPRTSSGRLQGCGSSNTGEIFYLFVPDPGGIAGRPHTVQFVRRIGVSIVGHEFQHLINASRRLYVNHAASFEELWLNEGLSHVAEELLFFAASPARPRTNLGVEQLTSTSAVLSAFNSYAVNNVANYARHLENPEEEALLGVTNLPTRGATWSFLRYAADRDPGQDEELFFELVNGNETGVENVSAALGADALRWMQDWSVSAYTDDAGLDVDGRYVQPSWNFRSVLPALTGGSRYPLVTRDVPSEVQQRFSLEAGGASYLRFGIGAGARAVLELTSDDESPPAALRTTVVRIR